MGAEACHARGSQSWGLKRSCRSHSRGGTVLTHHLARDGLEQQRPRPLSWRVFSAFRPTKSLWQFFCLRPRVCPVPLTRPVWGRIFGWRQSLVQATCSLPKLWIRQWLPFPSIWGDQHEWFGSPWAVIIAWLVWPCRLQSFKRRRLRWCTWAGRLRKRRFFPELRPWWHISSQQWWWRTVQRRWKQPTHVSRRGEASRWRLVVFVGLGIVHGTDNTFTL